MDINNESYWNNESPPGNHAINTVILKFIRIINLHAMMLYSFGLIHI